MRRAAVVTGITVIGAAWLLTYKVTAHPAGLATAAPTTPPPDQGSAQPSRGSSPPAAASASGTYTGQDVPNRFGDVQVRVVVTNGHITDVEALRLPTDRAESAYISSIAGPRLRGEVIQAQSARIDIVSGATYTSDSYAQSVESALQQAHLG